MIAPEAKGPGSALLLVDLTTGDIKRITRSTGNPDRLRRCQWTTNTRLAARCSSSSTARGERCRSPALAINSDGTGLKMLTSEINSRSLGVIQSGGGVIDLIGDGGDGSTLMTRTFVSENSTGTHMAKEREGLGVGVVDTLTLKRRTIEQPKPDAVEYYSDGHGVARVMGCGRAKTSTISSTMVMCAPRCWKKRTRSCDRRSGYSAAAGRSGLHQRRKPRDLASDQA